MAEMTQRPIFFEGQILGAADLSSAADYGRNQQARHERHQHTWGIVEGLWLSGEERKTAGNEGYLEVFLTPGAAVDASGRELLLPERVRVSEGLFDELSVEDPNDDPDEPTLWYPVFVRGYDAEAGPGGNGACGRRGQSRVEERVEVTFARPGDAQLPQEAPAEVASGPAGGVGAPAAYRVLVGFVQWKRSIGKFSAVADSREGVDRKYAGVRADEVVARGGRLQLTSGLPAEGGKRVGVALDGREKGVLVFGPQADDGTISPVLRMRSNGDLEVEGSVKSPVTAQVFVGSGVATDGMRLPLPGGVTEEQVASGNVVLHIHVTPRWEGLSPAGGDPAQVAVPLECRVSDRRVHCRFRWFDPGSAVPLFELPGACDFTILAYVPPTAGGG